MKTESKTSKPSTSLTDSAYALLKGRIIACDLPPGAIVTESRLASDIGLGKTPTRDALTRLSSEGLVRPMSRKGYEVLPLTMGEVSHLFEAFRIVAVEAAALIAERASSETKQRLRDLTLEWAPGNGANDSDIHEHLSATPFPYIFEATANPVVAKMASPIIALYERVMNFALLHGGWADSEYTHRRDAVHEAWDEGDPDKARTAMREIIDFGEQEVMRILQSLDAVRNAPL